MNRKERRAAQAKGETLFAAPDDPRWTKAAEDMIANYDGDSVKLVKDLIVALQHEQQQVAYLQAEFENIAKAYPGMFKISYNDHSGAAAHAIGRAGPGSH